MSPGELAIDDFDRAALGRSEFHHYRQANASALHRAAGRSARIERVEDVSAILRRNSLAGVGDVQHQLVALPAGEHVDLPLPR